VTRDERKESVVGRKVVTDVRLEPENSSGNSAVELTAKKKKVWGKKNKTRDDQTSPKQPSDPRSLVPAVPSLSPKNTHWLHKANNTMSGFFASLLTV